MVRLCVDALTRMPDLQHVAGGVALLYLGMWVVYFEQMGVRWARAAPGAAVGLSSPTPCTGCTILSWGALSLGRPAALSKGGGPQQQYTRPLYGSSVLWNS